MPGRRYQRVHQDVDRHDVHPELLVANDAPDRAPSDFHHDARDAAHVVHPSFERFSPRSGHCGKKQDLSLFQREHTVVGYNAVRITRAG